VVQYTRLDKLAKDKHSSLLNPFVNYEENYVFVSMIPGTNFSRPMFFVLQCYITLGWKGLLENEVL